MLLLPWIPFDFPSLPDQTCVSEGALLEPELLLAQAARGAVSEWSCAQKWLYKRSCASPQPGHGARAQQRSCPCLQGARAVSHSQGFTQRWQPGGNSINSSVLLDGEPLRLEQEHTAGYTHCSQALENVSLTFEEMVASSSESSVQTPGWLRSQVSDTGDRFSPGHGGSAVDRHCPNV